MFFYYYFQKKLLIQYLIFSCFLHCVENVFHKYGSYEVADHILSEELFIESVFVSINRVRKWNTNSLYKHIDT